MFVSSLRAQNSNTFDDPASTGYSAIAMGEMFFNTVETIHGAYPEYQPGSFNGMAIFAYNNTFDNVANYTLYKNSVATAATIQIPAATTGMFYDLTHRVDFVANDTLSLYVDTSTTTTGQLDCKKVFWLIYDDSINPPVKYKGSSFTPVAATTFYYTWQALSSATEATVQMNMNCAGNWNHLYVRSTANTLNDPSVFKSRVNGADGAQSVTIPGLTTGDFVDSTNSDNLVSGDDVNYQVVTGATGTSITFRIYSDFQESTKRTFSVVTGSTSQLTLNVRYRAISGDGNLNTTQRNTQNIFPMACKATNLQYKVFSNTLTTSKQAVLTTSISGNQGNMAIQVPATTTGWFEDTTGVDYINQGDTYNFMQTVQRPNTGLAILTSHTTVLFSFMDVDSAWWSA